MPNWQQDTKHLIYLVGSSTMPYQYLVTKGKIYGISVLITADLGVG